MIEVLAKFLFGALTAIVGVIWVFRGIQYIQGKKAYKSWLSSRDPLTRKIGFSYIGAGIGSFLAMPFAIFKESPFVFGPCLGLPIIFFAIVYTSQVHIEILKLEPETVAYERKEQS